MLIGVPKEIKNHEYRVGMTPASVKELIQGGHKVIVEHCAGAAIDLTDEQYRAAGAEIATSIQAVYERADMIVKVKEPQPGECAMLRKGQILFTYLHLAPDPKQTRLLLDSGCIAIAYETVTDKNGRLPLLEPMSEVAGRLSVQAGAHTLEIAQQGRGMLLGGVPGVSPAKVVVLGGGVVGTQAAKIAMGMGAKVTIVDKSLARLRALDEIYGPTLSTVYSSTDSIDELVPTADLIIGAVLIPGGTAPKLITRQHVSSMQAGAVLVDVAIDQGGCFASSHPTTHGDPTFVIDKVVHYCVANMPGAVARTSTFALNHATQPFIQALADKGCQKALLDDPHLCDGLNVFKGKITYKAVAEALGSPYVPAADFIN